ncbi:hypothetical protein ACEWY4_006109 [Coilia grayii]|uniref:Immunoglobulin subtype domain-containing protein n=1 Tax=Coilia grayii TaxID=363190 RepID=A0ABD1KCQ5_9TELE
MSTVHHLLLVAAILHTVSCAPETVFAPMGNSVTLIMNEHDIVEKDYAVWIFNQKDIVRYYPHHPENHRLRVLPSYKSRVEFDTRDLSMELRDLQKTDSGLFKGIIKTPKHKTVVQYKLLVLETVQKPILTADADWSIGDLCNLTATCRAGDLSLTSTCNSSTCTQDGDSAHGDLTIIIKHGSIVCNHSNPVSWSHAAVEVKNLCPFTQQLDSLFGYKQTVIISTAVGVIVLLVALIGGVLRFHMHFKKPADHPKKVNDTEECPTPLLPKKHPSEDVCPEDYHIHPVVYVQTPSDVKGQTSMQHKSPTPGTSVRKRKNYQSPEHVGVDPPQTAVVGSADKRPPVRKSLPF